MALYTTTFSAPSNIAVVKYWGKRDAGKLNLPLNSSLSVTMDQVGFYSNISLSRATFKLLNTMNFPVEITGGTSSCDDDFCNEEIRFFQ